jgi:hypothetical protein
MVTRYHCPKFFFPKAANDLNRIFCQIAGINFSILTNGPILILLGSSARGVRAIVRSRLAPRHDRRAVRGSYDPAPPALASTRRFVPLHRGQPTEKGVGSRCAKHPLGRSGNGSRPLFRRHAPEGGWLQVESTGTRPRRLAACAVATSAPPTPKSLSSTRQSNNPRTGAWRSWLIVERALRGFICSLGLRPIARAQISAARNPSPVPVDLQGHRIPCLLLSCSTALAQRAARDTSPVVAGRPSRQHAVARTQVDKRSKNPERVTHCDIFCRARNAFQAGKRAPHIVLSS